MDTQHSDTPRERPLVEFMARILCDARWGEGTWEAGGRHLNRAYWRRKAKQHIEKQEALDAQLHGQGEAQ